jgi:hypothetical protein
MQHVDMADKQPAGTIGNKTIRRELGDEMSGEDHVICSRYTRAPGKTTKRAAPHRYLVTTENASNAKEPRDYECMLVEEVGNEV